MADPHVVNIKAESGSIVSVPIVCQNNIGGGVSNSIDGKCLHTNTYVTWS